MPFLNDYFQTAITQGRLAHCILLYGQDLQAQYDLALEIARKLNCTGDDDCLNCRWIRENKHPAVLTISKVDNKPADDDSSTVISVAQARMIKNDLLGTSDYHRVLIFCDKDKDGNICALNETNFQAETANALLKILEEPPSNTTFFFLTKDKSDMISTIISRAQSFFVPSTKDENRDFDLVKDLMDWYLEIERTQVLEFNDKLLELTKENDPLEVFTQMQNYLAPNRRDALKAIETAKKQLRLNINIQTVVENLAFSLILDILP